MKVFFIYFLIISIIVNSDDEDIIETYIVNLKYGPKLKGQK